MATTPTYQNDFMALAADDSDSVRADWPHCYCTYSDSSLTTNTTSGTIIQYAKHYIKYVNIIIYVC